MEPPLFLLLGDNGAPNISLQKRFSSTAMPSILSPSDVMKKGLGYIGIGKEQQAKMSLKVKVEDFKAHYGSSPLVIADIWHDLCHTSIEEAHLEEKETSEKGFKRYMIALFFLWTYPKNINLMTTRFDICKRYLEGKELKVSNYFTFPEQGVAVALRPGDMLLFNPLYHHCLSSRTTSYQNDDVFCLSLYLKTAIVGKNDNALPITEREKLILQCNGISC
jgi:hypothetical protein